MERYQTIDEYVAAEMGDKIKRKAKSPLLGLLILAVGIFLLVMLRTQKMGDTLMTTCLTAGIIALGAGVVITAMCLTGAISHYVYNPTHSRMKQRKCYLSLDDYKLCIEAIGNNNIAALGGLQPVTSSNSALNILYSRDHAVALLQAIRDNSGHFEPETPVIQLTGNEVNAVQQLCK
ncbi:MAG: hypothetical protein IJU19_04445 [Bacteroidales bacterium]|nr:hypothetical protein [Bacteroidales bacterium]